MGDLVAEAFGKFDETTVTSKGVAKKTKVDLDRSAVLGAIAPLLSKPNFCKDVVNIVGGGFLDRFIKVLVFVLLGGRSCFLL